MWYPTDWSVSHRMHAPRCRYQLLCADGHFSSLCHNTTDNASRSYPSPIKTQVLISSLGFALFGMGCDITGITISKIITKWFAGHELASAMGVQVATARLGTASALSLSPLLAQSFGISASVLAGVAVLVFSFILFIVYCPIDRVFDKQHRTARYTLQQPTTVSAQKEGGDDGFRFNDFVKVLRTPGFWLVAFVCVFFYSSIRPFMKFATDLLVNSFNVNDETAGWIVAAIPYGTILLTPAFGAINDRHNNGPILMTIGCAIVSASHLLLAFP